MMETILPEVGRDASGGGGLERAGGIEPPTFSLGS